jgi:hypothetical protein
MYTAKEIEKVKDENGREYPKIGIFENEEKVGEFLRNYSSYGVRTFAPFKIKDQWFALYSPNYTCIKIMSLPDCQEIGGEKSSAYGFCPVDIFVPQYQIHEWTDKDGEIQEVKEYDPECFEPEKEIFYENFAFVAGCVWGDDNSWKIEIRDISQTHEGIIKNIPEWGYYEIPHNLSLKECVKLDAFSRKTNEEKESINATITLTKTIRLNKGDGDIKLQFFD